MYNFHPSGSLNCCFPQFPSRVGAVTQTNLLFSHLGELVEEGEVLGQVLAVRLHAVLHDGQQRLNEASDAGSTPNILHRAVHVVGTANSRED